MNVQTPKRLNGNHSPTSRHGTNEEQISDIAKRGAVASNEEATEVTGVIGVIGATETTVKTAGTATTGATGATGATARARR